MSKTIAVRIARELDLPAERQEVIEYGALGLLSQSLSIFLLLLCAYILNMVKEVLILVFCSAILRNYSGGAHCSSPLRCALLSVIAVPLLVVISKFIYGLGPVIYIITIILISLISICIYYIYSPVDSPSKPIRNKDKIKRLKFRSVVLSLFFLGLSMFLLLINHGQTSVLITLGVFYQAFTLTMFGHLYVGFFDKTLGGI